jgi:hypothetical protein
MSIHFVPCEACGKRLIERTSNGIWKFKFGRRGKKGSQQPVVNMEIYGSLRLTCFRSSCGHVNVLNFMPNNESKVLETREPKTKINKGD